MATKKKTEKPEADPVMTEDRTVEIAGVTYTVRRLGLRDVFRVARIIGGGVHVLGDTTGQYSPSQVLQVLVASMTRAEDEVLKLIADVLNVDRATLDDPDAFPMDSLIDILEVVANSQDLQSFFAKVEGMMGRLPEMQTASEGPSSS